MSGGLDFDVKDRVKQATDIVDLLGGYMQLRRQGAQFVAHCPWHDDRRPSLQINPARQSWVCWVCNIRGDIFDFVMRREGVEFYDALRMLADRVGVSLKTFAPQAKRGSPEDKQTLYKAMAWAAELFQNCLTESDHASLARTYLGDRQISTDISERFKLGFSPLESSWLLNSARSTEFSPAILEACGLVVKNERSTSWYERFSGRLIFPIQDTMGRVIAFGGRVVPGVFPEGKEPGGKYYNSPETRLFSKSENLYGLNHAAESVARSRHLIVMEGYTDVIGAYQAGMRGVVAALGTAVNQRHVRLMKRYADKITLVLDGDAVGQRRTNEVLDLFVAENVDLRILSLPEGADPFDFVQTQGAEPLQLLIDAAPDALEHRVRSETKGVDLVNDTHRSNQALDRILQTIAHVPASVTTTSAGTRLRQEQLLARLARMFRVDREILQARLLDLRARTAGIADELPGKENNVVRLASFDPAELELLGLLLLDHSLLDLAVENVSVDAFRDGPLREIYEHVCEGFHSAQDVSFEGLMVHFETTATRSLLMLIDEQTNLKQVEAALDCRQRLDLILEIFRRRADHHGERQLIGELEDSKLDSTEEVFALEELLRKARQRHGISAPTDG